MTEEGLRCNNLRSCRKPLSLSSRAVVTTCSHIFCVDCAELLFNASKCCPACDTLLAEPDDVVICTLNPTNDYRTSVLSGLSPSIIMEIATRALSFWQYQMTQEAAFQSMLLQKSQERAQSLNHQIQMLTGEFSVMSTKQQATERDLEKERRKSRDLAEASREKEREYGKLKNQHDKLRRKALLLPINHSTVSPPAIEMLPSSSSGRNTNIPTGGVGLSSIAGTGGDLLLQRPIRTPNTHTHQASGPWRPSPSPRLSTGSGSSHPLQPLINNHTLHQASLSQHQHQPQARDPGGDGNGLGMIQQPLSRSRSRSTGSSTPSEERFGGASRGTTRLNGGGGNMAWGEGGSHTGTGVQQIVVEASRGVMRHPSQHKRRLV